MMYDLLIGANIFLSLLVAIRYVEETWHKRANPALATWVVMLLVMGILVFMYSQSPKKTWTGNINMVAGAVGSLVIFFGVLITNVRDKTLHLAFNRVQIFSLVGCGLVMGFWIVVKNPFIAYIVVQGLALVAYFPTFHRLLTTRRVSEPINAWILSLASNVLGIYPAWVKNDTHAWIHLGRTTGITLFVLTVIAWKNRQAKKTSSCA